VEEKKAEDIEEKLDELGEKPKNITRNNFKSILIL
jgi:hypothetical protein